ncbi:urea ABC transporter substrate-binding protein [Streptomyces europaeiscabiei]|uniref:Urea ABC transporter substrate-binding protein n=1 Tax=Streptomyces europaeiscabiei TaxID=146819 RepID=A0ABU4NEP8_9ACTN|nr:urea ABC transporter substrate-binding protein [Streptomyces europaeiscabiei]MDX3544254.1 urea ABC transporter substrate-binding protein [Streptomyces europaeiscabiei]MDX3552488.1 urea ABC transporter substrate-binding protein [Streptomyces europaeiscabiei]MDX3701280.1 urea ABC transporter substrate-binding protein [Streptomyces europaeiscabiei]MDX3862237.1 urea ABC transporter substrate-binding protein [Streptomyces europaeiscabiei]MDX3875584.1 urea ABC transporter substrate-binding protei
MSGIGINRRGLLAGASALGTTVALSACGAKTGSGTSSAAGAQADTSGDTVKVGLLNSLSGTMAISEVTVHNALLLAVKEINAAGGVLGKKLKPISQDGASDWPTFAEKAEALITDDKVVATFGCWTSASRKAVKPVFERYKSLLFYPVQYEGLEQSPYIFYVGATTNQQIVPALDYLKKQGLTRLYLVGSDYVFPRTANKIIKAYAQAQGMKVVGEDYAPLGSTEFSTIVNKVKDAGADAVFNTLNGDSNVAFFKEYKSAGLAAKSLPVLSVSIAEEEVKSIGTQYLEGQLTAWNYYETTPGAANTKFVAAYQAAYGKDKPTSDPMEAAYISLYLWKEMVEKAGSFDVPKVKKASGGIELDAPEGKVTVDGATQHVYKTARIGRIGSDGLIEEVWNSGKPIKPDPYLKGYDWAAGLS